MNRDIQERVVALIDMDCFYVQVEQRAAPEWKGKPCAVVQYLAWKGGGIIAVGYEARAKGVTRRGMRGDDAKKLCPEIKLFQVPEVRGKSDLTKYREAGAEVISVLSQFAKCVERASIDEAYVDLTSEVEEMMNADQDIRPDDLPDTFVVGLNDDDREASVRDWLLGFSNTDSLDYFHERRLAYGAVIVEKMRKAVRDQTGFTCSAGVSHNKVLSKLACGLHKPQKQTILTMDSVSELFSTLPIPKVRHLGGKLGRSLMNDYGLANMGDICKLSLRELTSSYGQKTAQFVYDICRGHDPEPVSSRQVPKSIGCSKNFPSTSAITDYQKARYWLRQFSGEMEERLIKDRQQNNRVSKSLYIYVRFSNRSFVTRACSLPRYTLQCIENSAMNALVRLCGDVKTLDPSITCLGLSAGKFDEIEGQSISSFFKSHQPVNVFESLETSSTQSKKDSIKVTEKKHKSKQGNLSQYLSDGHVASPFDPSFKSQETKTSLKGLHKYFCKNKRSDANTSSVEIMTNAMGDVPSNHNNAMDSSDIISSNSYHDVDESCSSNDVSHKVRELGFQDDILDFYSDDSNDSGNSNDSYSSAAIVNKLSIDLGDQHELADTDESPESVLNRLEDMWDRVNSAIGTEHSSRLKVNTKCSSILTFSNTAHIESCSPITPTNTSAETIESQEGRAGEIYKNTVIRNEKLLVERVCSSKSNEASTNNTNNHKEQLVSKKETHSFTTGEDDDDDICIVWESKTSSKKRRASTVEKIGISPNKKPVNCISPNKRSVNSTKKAANIKSKCKSLHEFFKPL